MPHDAVGKLQRRIPPGIHDIHRPQYRALNIAGADRLELKYR